MSTHAIDLNCDMGEGFPHDLNIMEYISSCNICCNAHAGTEELIEITMSNAKEYGLNIGAHPGYDDRDYFGRRFIEMDNQSLRDLLLWQFDLFFATAQKLNAKVRHVKAHGAMYHYLNGQEDAARTYLEAICEYAPGLMVFGMPGSVLREIAPNYEMHFVAEGFADRAYLNGQELIPRKLDPAMLQGDAAVLEQFLGMVKAGKVVDFSGIEHRINVDSICLHGDAPNVLDVARLLFACIYNNNVALEPIRLG